MGHLLSQTISRMFQKPSESILALVEPESFELKNQTQDILVKPSPLARCSSWLIWLIGFQGKSFWPILTLFPLGNLMEQILPETLEDCIEQGGMAKKTSSAPLRALRQPVLLFAWSEVSIYRSQLLCREDEPTLSISHLAVSAGWGPLWRSGCFRSYEVKRGSLMIH